MRAFIGSVDGGAVPASSDEFPAHWTDKKHEPDGTAHRHIVVEGSVEEASVGQFTTGPNVGADLLKQEMNALTLRYDGGVDCIDDTTGAPLVETLMREARKVEMELFERMGVWAERLPKATVLARGGKIIKGRWVDVNKGDTARPDYRSRFVGKEYNTGVDPTLYAATPPLEALKLLLGYAASDTTKKIHIMLSDVKRAYFHALAKR